LAASPLRVLTPRNHGQGAWIYLAGLGGGLVSGDRYQIEIEARDGSTALVTTQASTKVYRSSTGSSQDLRCRVADGGLLVLLPDPVVCFGGARYAQRTEVDLAPGASAIILDGFTCGRGARGERWKFDRYESRSSLKRGNRETFVEAVRLDPAHGPLGVRMGRFDVVLSLVAVGPRAASVRDAILHETPRPALRDAALGAASPIGSDGAVLRVVAERFEHGTRLFRPSFAALTKLLGDDPFVRKW
jgi:urease accessory protein